MSKAFSFFLTLALVVILLFIIQLLASERVEVVELYTVDQKDKEVSTRLWVADDHGYQYLRVGADGSEWFDRMQLQEIVELTRNGRRYKYTWALREEKSQKINRLMYEKYGWSDSFIGTLIGGRENSIPIELRLAN
jgi:hypothetical protein